MKRFLSLCLGLAAFTAIPVLAQAPPQVPTGKIHGHVINPSGAPQASGNVTAVLVTRAASGPGLSPQTEKQAVFQVDQNGEFGGDVPAGVDGRPSYSVKGDASHYTPVAGVRAAT